MHESLISFMFKHILKMLVLNGIPISVFVSKYFTFRRSSISSKFELPRILIDFYEFVGLLIN